MSKTDLREQLMIHIYNEIAQVVLLREIKLGKDSCIEPDSGRKLSTEIRDKIVQFVTPLDLMLLVLERKGYVHFEFKKINDEYWKYEFTAFKEGWLQNFRRAPEDGNGAVIKFQGRSKEEAVSNAIIAEGETPQGRIIAG